MLLCLKNTTVKLNVTRIPSYSKNWGYSPLQKIIKAFINSAALQICIFLVPYVTLLLWSVTSGRKMLVVMEGRCRLLTFSIQSCAHYMLFKEKFKEHYCKLEAKSALAYTEPQQLSLLCPWPPLSMLDQTAVIVTAVELVAHMLVDLL